VEGMGRRGKGYTVGREMGKRHRLTSEKGMVSPREGRKRDVKEPTAHVRKKGKGEVPLNVQDPFQKKKGSADLLTFPRGKKKGGGGEVGGRRKKK